jgi:hypothetical protein
VTGWVSKGQVLREWHAIFAGSKDTIVLWEICQMKCGKSGEKREIASSCDGHFLNQVAFILCIIKHVVNHPYKCLFCLSFELASSPPSHTHNRDSVLTLCGQLWPCKPGCSLVI